MGSSLPENFIQKMEERMKNPEGALMSIKSKDIDPSKAMSKEEFFKKWEHRRIKV